MISLHAKFEAAQIYHLTISGLPPCVSLQVRFQNTMSGKTFVWLGDSNSKGIAQPGKLLFGQAVSVRIKILDAKFADEVSMHFVHRDLSDDLLMEDTTYQPKPEPSYSPFFPPQTSIDTYRVNQNNTLASAPRTVPVAQES